MKKAFIFGALGMIVVLGIVLILAGYGNAGLTDTKTSITVAKGDNLTLGAKEIVYKEIWETYKPIEIKSVTDEVLFKGAIVEHTAQCGSDCYSVVEIYKEKDGILIDDLYLNDEQGNKLDIKPNIEISNSYKDVEVIDYKEVCKTTDLKNGTKVNDCSQVQSGSHFIKEPIYEKYTLGNSVKAGNYLIKPSAIFEVKLGESKTYDWIMVVDGKTLSEWATWDSTLNTNLISYYSFNNNNVFDSIATGTNLTDASGTVSITGKISLARNFTTIKALTRAVGSVPIGTNAVTVCLWVYTDKNEPEGNAQGLFQYGTTAGHGYDFVLGFNNARQFNLGGFYHDINAGTSVNGAWQFVCGVQTNGDSRSLWVDGLNVGNGTETYSIATSGISIGIDATNVASGSYFSEDDISVFNKALSYTEINSIYSAGLSGNGYGYNMSVTNPCIFNGSVKYNNGTGVVNARIVITNVNTDDVFGNVTANANGLWNKSVATNGNYTVYAYINGNKTGGGDIKSYVECIQTIT